MSSRTGAVLAASLLALAACGDSRSTEPRPSIHVSLAVAQQTLDPGDGIDLTVSATGADGAALTYVKVQAQGMLSLTDSLPVGPAASTTITRHYTLPETPAVGNVVFRAVAGNARDSAEATVTRAVGSSDAPVIESASASPSGLVQPGDTVTVSYRVTGIVPLTTMRVQFIGLGIAVEDVVSANHAQSFQRTVRLRLPAGTPVATQMTVRLDAYNQNGRHTPRSVAVLAVTDTSAPALSYGYGLTVGGAYTGVDTLTFTLGATDNHRLAWLGYRLGTPVGVQDSVAAGDSAATASLHIPVQPTWSGKATLTLFARDAAGNLAEATSQPGAFTFFPVVRRPYVRIPFAGAPREAAYDAKRDLLYLVEPFYKRISVLSVAARTLASPISLPSSPGGFDLTDGGDSLLVALPAADALGVIDLRAATPALTLLPLTFAHDGARHVDNVRVAAGGRAFVALADDYGTPVQLLEVDLATGAQRLRDDAALGTTQDGTISMLRPIDRRMLAFASSPPCLVLYTAATDRFSPCASFGPSIGTITADATDSRFFLVGRLYDATPAFLRQLVAPRIAANYASITPDGAAVYFDTDFLGRWGEGLTKVRTSDGAPLEWTPLPTSPEFFGILPDGQTLYAFGLECAAGSVTCPTAPSLYLVDLR